MTRCLGRCFRSSTQHASLHPSRPEGRRTGCAPFSDRAMDGESENPGHVPDRCLALSRRHFFGDFLCASKESYPPDRAEAFCSSIDAGFSPVRSTHPTFRCPAAKCASTCPHPAPPHTNAPAPMNPAPRSAAPGLRSRRLRQSTSIPASCARPGDRAHDGHVIAVAGRPATKPRSSLIASIGSCLR